MNSFVFKCPVLLTVRTFLAVLVAVAAVACGGGGDSGASPAPGSNLAVSGLAATGAPMANAVVSVKCVTGATVSGVTGADGSFNLTLQAGQTLPCMIKVTRGNPDVTLYSLATGTGYVNVTPLTDLVLAQALGADPAAAFAPFGSASASRIEAALPAAKAYVSAQIQALLGSSPEADALSGRFQIGDADDKLLDALGVKLGAAKKTMSDLRELAAKGGDLKALLQIAEVPPGGEADEHDDDDDDDDDEEDHDDDDDDDDEKPVS
jgi:hypothetical protein